MKNVDYNVRAACAINAQSNQVGKIAKTFGLDGQLVIKLWDNFPENYNEPLWVSIDSLAVPLFVGRMEPQGPNKAVVVFDDFENETLALMLVGLNLYAENAQADELNDKQEFDLRGANFVDLTTGIKGVITNYFEDSYNPLLELTSDDLKEPVLVPFNENLIADFNKKKQIITFELPLGIFDLNN